MPSALGVAVAPAFTVVAVSASPPGYEEAVQYLSGGIVESAGSWFFVDSINPSENPAIINNNILSSDGSAILTFSDLTGVAIVSQEGTATAAISGDTITLTAGYIDDIVLDDGTHLKFAEGAADTAYDASGNGNHATISGGYSWIVSAGATVRPDNLLDGFTSYVLGSDTLAVPYDVNGNPISI